MAALIRYYQIRAVKWVKCGWSSRLANQKWRSPVLILPRDINTKQKHNVELVVALILDSLHLSILKPLHFQKWCAFYRYPFIPRELIPN